MKFLNTKFTEMRKKKHISVNYIASNMSINRGTLWLWEKGSRIPSEKQIRQLAKILDISVSGISDLQESIPVSDFSLNEAVTTLLRNISPKELGTPKIYDGLINFIWELKKRDEQSSVLINSVLNSTNMMFYIKDLNLKFVSVNDIFFKTFSPDPDMSYLGKKDNVFFAKTEAEENMKEDEQVIITGKPIINKESYLPGTRRKKWGLISKYPILDFNNKITGVIGAFIDITEKKENEESLQLMRFYIEKITLESLTIRDLDNGRYIYINESKERIYGRPRSEFFEKGKSFWMEECIHPEDRERVRKIVLEGIENRINIQNVEFQFRILRPDGEARLIDCRTFYLKYKGFDVSVHVERDMS